MAHSNWQFFLAESSDLTRLAEVSRECRNKSFQLALNRAGTFSCTLPLDTDSYNYLNPLEHCIIAVKDGVVVWSGLLLLKEESFSSSQITLNYVGWFNELLVRYITDADHTYTTTNEGQIVFNLLDLANDYEISAVNYPTHITEGTNTSVENRTKTFERWQNIGEEIQALTEIEASFDFEVDPVTRELNIKNEDEFNDLTDVIFGFNWGPNNVQEVTRSTDGATAKNEWFIRGTYGTAHTWDTTSIGQYGLRQEVLEISELSDTDIGGAIANAELAVNKDPRILINFDPRPEGEMGTTPHLFEDYNIGDKVYLNAIRHNAIVSEQAIRIFGVNFSIDEIGNERVSSLEVTNQSS